MVVVTKHKNLLKTNQVDVTVTINMLFVPASIAGLSLSSFRDSARKGDRLHVVHDGSAWKVWASGAAMSEGSEVELDTIEIFVAALGRAFFRGIQGAVVRELGLDPKPGQPLESRLVLQAITMAEASWQALQGVDFMTQLMLSAAAHSSAFVEACRALGLAPDAVSAQQRAAVDACMRKRFAQAVRQGNFPVAPALAQQWLRAELMAVQTQAPASR